VVEFRHVSWWNKEVIERLGENKIAFCGMSHPDFPDDIIGNTDHLYYRMHGRQQLYASNYSQQELADIIEKIQSMKDVRRAYIYFNNDVNGYATENAKSLLKLAR
jgi:uncharacterized protein YecE (DUF72 family)